MLGVSQRLYSPPTKPFWISQIDHQLDKLEQMRKDHWIQVEERRVERCAAFHNRMHAAGEERRKINEWSRSRRKKKKVTKIPYR